MENEIFEKKPDNTYNWILGGIVVIVLLFLIYKLWYEGFKIMNPIELSPLPYSGGSQLRVQSIDTSTNRGENDTWY